jgi:hypothetical protein
MQLSPKRAVVVFSLGLCCLVSTACSDLLKKPLSNEAVAAKARVVGCEGKAANQYDDDRYKTFSELVQQVMDVCTAELNEVRSASDRSDKDEFNEAVEVIKNARSLRTGTASSQQEDKNKDKGKSKETRLAVPHN